ncbi:MAG: sigma-70 family RNA polymerase sigma factor [Planctomycetes bacterium]|nr:sigma-70 family RNA polymerase sigma factor [Planctomycetota bacterium]
MTGDLEADRLAEQIGWVRRLAHELVSDPHLAEDLVQETWLAFLRARPDTSRPLEPWFARVLRNFVRRARRGNARRTAREETAAKPEAIDSSAEVCARAALHRELVAAVLALDEPYRGALLLRYLDELPPREIARRQGVPVRTVNTRLRRGLAQLRARLDREHEKDRDSWLTGLAAFAASERARTLAPAAWLVGAGFVLLIGVGLAFAMANGAFRGAPSTAAFPAVVTSSSEVAAPVGASARSDAPAGRVAREPSTIGDSAWTGRVQDENGAPIADAVVRLVADARARLGRFDPPLQLEPTVLEETRSDAHGRFRIAKRFAGSSALDVRAVDFGAARAALAAAPTEELVVHLPRGAELVGRTLGADGLELGGLELGGTEPGGTKLGGMALGRVDVRVRAADGSRTMTSSEDDGRWRVTGLAPGTYRVDAFDARGAHATCSVELAAGERRTLDLTLHRTASVRGRVLDAVSRAPLSDAEVSLEPDAGTSALTDDRGEFSLAVPAALDRVQLRVREAQHVTRRIAIEPLPREGLVLELALERGRRAEGAVLDVDGSPLPYASVAAVADVWIGARHEFDRVSGRTDANGVFQLDGLRPDLQHSLLVWHAGRAPRDVSFPPNERELELVDLGRVQLAPGSTTTGRVLGEGRAPRGKIELVLLDLGPRGTRSASVEPSRWAAGRAFARTRTDEVGRFVFEDLPEGAWWVGTATAASRERASAEFDLAVGERVELELFAPAGAVVRGTVRDPAGVPVEGATIAATRAPDDTRSTQSERDGSFELAGLTADVWELRATPPAERELAPTTRTVHAPMDGVVLDLAAVEVVRGRVLDVDGAALAHARVEARDELGRAVDTAWCDAQGRFELALPRGVAMTVVARRTQPKGEWERAVTPGPGLELALTAERTPAAELELRFAQ